LLLWLGSNCFDPAILPPCFFFPSDLDAGFFALVPEATLRLPLSLLLWLLLELRLVLVPELLDRLAGLLEPATPRLDMPAEGSTTTQVRANVNQQGPHNFATVES
jgi:hypothetical protein